MRVKRRGDEWPQSQVTLTLDATLISMTSESLSADDLVELAGRLIRASDAPPRI
jgi:hypothetical protein